MTRLLRSPVKSCYCYFMGFYPCLHMGLCMSCFAALYHKCGCNVTKWIHKKKTLVSLTRIIFMMSSTWSLLGWCMGPHYSDIHNCGHSLAQYPNTLISYISWCIVSAWCLSSQPSASVVTQADHICWFIHQWKCWHLAWPFPVTLFFDSMFYLFKMEKTKYSANNKYNNYNKQPKKNKKPKTYHMGLTDKQTFSYFQLLEASHFGCVKPQIFLWFTALQISNYMFYVPLLFTSTHIHNFRGHLM